jgi:hypothetical protein
MCVISLSQFRFGKGDRFRNYLKKCYPSLYRSNYGSEVYGEEVDANYIETVSDEEESYKTPPKKH